MRRLVELFIRHPASVGETYFEHLATASSFGWRMLSGGFACFVHGLLPFLFQKTASARIAQLHDEMIVNRAKQPRPVSAAPGEQTFARGLGGVCLAVALALAAIAASTVTPAPAMLLALLLGLAIRASAPAAVQWSAPGLRFCVRTLLRIGVALLGVRVVANDILGLGPNALLLVLATVAVVVGGGYGLARLLRNPRDVSAISATSVAICGASAALAASAVAPQRQGLERETILVVLIVSLLSTLAMVIYPWLANVLALDEHGAAVLIGAAIHDVAQVAGAGFSVSSHVGVEAVTVKMIRVALLLPVLLAFSWSLWRGGGEGCGERAQPVIPTFLIVFLLLAASSSLGFLPEAVIASAGQAAAFLLTTSVVALGASTSLADLRSARPALVGAIALQTVLQLAVVTALVLVFFV